MTMIIPAILEEKPEEITKKFEVVKGAVSLAQIDVCDGVFVSSVTIQDPRVIAGLHPPVDLEIHLMANRPESVIEEWMKLENVTRVIVHLEAVTEWERILSARDHFQKEIGIALRPETPVHEARPFLDEISILLLLAIEPGAQGQSFQPEVMAKVAAAAEIRDRVFARSFQVGVDGGVNDENAADLAAAGANLLNVGSYLFEAPDFHRALSHLQRLVQGR